MDGMDFLAEIPGLVEERKIDDSFANLIKGNMDQRLLDKSYPKHFRITDITNPAQAYYSRKNQKVKIPQDIARKLAIGNHLHALASYWFRNLEGFCIDESDLDGIWLDIPVTGRIDYRVGKNIIEFKTKSKIPETVVEVFSRYPNDLEQLVFYSLIDPSHPKINYLVFMNDKRPHGMKSFKVEITDRGRIKSLLLNRIKLIENAIENDDPSSLGTCRYYESGCQFDREHICECKNSSPIETGNLANSIKISVDDDLTKKLMEIRNDSNTIDAFSVSLRDIIAPRKHYLQEVIGNPPFFEEKYPGYFACFNQSIKKIIEKNELIPTKNETDTIGENKKDFRVRTPFRWINYKTTPKPEGVILPYTVKVSSGKNILSTKDPHEYYITELGLICSLYGLDSGLIMVVYPELDKLVRVFRIKYRGLKKVTESIKQRIDEIIKAEDEEDISLIVPCPSWMNDKGECPLMMDCHSGNIEGC